MSIKRVSLQQRKDIFYALVAAQDRRTMSIAESKKQIIQDYSITADQLEEIVNEGVEKEWLDEIVTVS